MIFLHNGSQGDIIYSLPFVITIGGGTYCLTRKEDYDFLKPLLLTQKCVDGVIYGQPKEVKPKEHLNLNLYRCIEAENLRGRFGPDIQHLAVLYFTIFNRKMEKFDLQKPWLFDITPKKIGKIVINKTSRYQNKGIYQRNFDWKVLSKYKDDCVFVGFDKEQQFLKDLTGLNIGHYKCEDALEMAQVIAGASLFIGNQSLPFALAEALKQNRVLDVCWRYPNCIPATKNGHIELTEAIVEEYINQGN